MTLEGGWGIIEAIIEQSGEVVSGGLGIGMIRAKPGLKDVQRPPEQPLRLGVILLILV